jgi:hypothetical protein
LALGDETQQRRALAASRAAARHASTAHLIHNGYTTPTLAERVKAPRSISSVSQAARVEGGRARRAAAPVHDAPPHGLLVRLDEADAEQLDEFVPQILIEIQAGAPRALQHEESQVRVRTLDAGVEHADEDRQVLAHGDRQLLLLLHPEEAGLVHRVRIVEI